MFGIFGTNLFTDPKLVDSPIIADEGKDEDQQSMCVIGTNSDGTMHSVTDNDGRVFHQCHQYYGNTSYYGDFSYIGECTCPSDTCINRANFYEEIYDLVKVNDFDGLKALYQEKQWLFEVYKLKMMSDKMYSNCWDTFRNNIVKSAMHAGSDYYYDNKIHGECVSCGNGEMVIWLYDVVGYDFFFHDVTRISIPETTSRLSKVLLNNEAEVLTVLRWAQENNHLGWVDQYWFNCFVVNSLEVGKFLSEATGIIPNGDTLGRICMWSNITMEHKEKVVRWILSFPQNKNIKFDEHEHLMWNVYTNDTIKSLIDGHHYHSRRDACGNYISSAVNHLNF